MHLTTLAKSQTRNLSTVVDVCAPNKYIPALEETRVFRSTIGPPFSQRNRLRLCRRTGVAHNLHHRIDTERDTATSAAFVIRGPEITHTPFFQRNACRIMSPG